jgi:hypothetical protein
MIVRVATVGLLILVSTAARAQEAPSCTAFLADARDDRDMRPYVFFAGEVIAQLNNMYVSRGCKSEIPWNMTRDQWIKSDLKHIYDACTNNPSVSVMQGIWNLHHELRQAIKNDGADCNH